MLFHLCLPGPATAGLDNAMSLGECSLAVAGLVLNTYAVFFIYVSPFN